MTSRPTSLATVPRRLGVAALTLAAACALAACQINSPVTTDLPYDPADGVSVDAGAVKVRDLLIVSEGDGASGVVSGLLVNTGAEPVTVQLTAGETPLEPAMEVPPGGAVRLDGRSTTGEQGEQGAQGENQGVTVPAVDVAAGATLPVQVSTSTGGLGSAVVPVLLPVDQYEEMLGDQAAETSG